MVAGPSQTWWSRPGLEVRGGRLFVAGRDAEGLARTTGTPAYVYDLTRIEEQASALRDALAGAGLRGLVRLALKAQREPDVLAFLRERCPWVGLDVCSPGEVAWALGHGWRADEISYTGTNLSERDLDMVLGTGVHLNLDLLTQLDRVGRRAPGTSVGVRVNPRVTQRGAVLLVDEDTVERGVHLDVVDPILNERLDLVANDAHYILEHFRAGSVRLVAHAGLPAHHPEIGGRRQGHLDRPRRVFLQVRGLVAGQPASRPQPTAHHAGRT